MAADPPEVEAAKDQPALERSVYLEERKTLIDLKSRAIQNLDKTLTTLAAGAIGLSFAFVRQISQSPVQDKKLLFASWFLLVGSLTSVLLSLFLSQFSLRRMQDNLDEYYKRQRDEGKNPWSTFINLLNITSLLSFILGVVVTAIFISENLN